MFLQSLKQFSVENAYKPAVIFFQDNKYNVLGYKDFYDTSERISIRFSEFEKSSVVLLILQHHSYSLMAYTGVMMAGLIPSFLPFPTPKQDPAYFWKNQKALLARIKPAAVVAYKDILETLEEICPPETAILLIDDLVAGLASDVEVQGHPAAAPDDIMLLQHSSGTTGLQKGVKLTFAHVQLQVDAYAGRAGLGRESVVASWLPFYHDMGLFTAYLIPLSLGATVVLLDPFVWVREPASLLRAIGEFRATHCWMPNFAFKHLVNSVAADEGFDLSSLKAFISCSEPIKPQTIDSFVTRFAGCGIDPTKVQACYAMAEACFAVTQSELMAVPRRVQDPAGEAGQASALPTLVSNGAILPGIDLRIVPTEGASSGVGEIQIRGPFVFTGYFQNDAATEVAFKDEWYRTGDIGFVDGNEVFICGRAKEIIIVNGRNIFSNDVELILSDIAGLLPGRAVALSVPGSDTERLIIVAESATDPSAPMELTREIKSRIYSELEVVPHSVHLVPPGWLRKTTSGKISRSENLARYLSEFGRTK